MHFDVGRGCNLQSSTSSPAMKKRFLIADTGPA
jgi:hypothetical protein